MPQPNNKSNKIRTQDDRSRKYIKLVHAVRTSKDARIAQQAFCDIVNTINPRLKNFLYNFRIPGWQGDDIYQQALFALRYKAIKDYDFKKSQIVDISPFQNFAIVCIRRHLTTQLKASYQNRQRTLNTSVSIDQGRSIDGSQDVRLSDILIDKKQSCPNDSYGKKQCNRGLLNSLFAQLSTFQKQVLYLYTKKMSYSQMADLLIKTMPQRQRTQVLLTSSQKQIRKVSSSSAAKNAKRKKQIQKLIQGGLTIQDLALQNIKNMQEEKKNFILKAKTMKSIDNSLARVKMKAKAIKQSIKLSDQKK